MKGTIMIIRKIKRYLKRFIQRFTKKKHADNHFFENASELVFTPFIKADRRQDHSLKLSRDAETSMGGRFKSGY